MAIWPLDAVTSGAAASGELPLYVSGGRWLHPLFDLLDLLAVGDPAAGDPADERAALVAAGELFLRDRVIGRAAAFLALRAGIHHAWADLVSDGAVATFEQAGASIGWGTRIPAIGCATEALLRDVDDAQAAWELLLERRRLSRARG